MTKWFGPFSTGCEAQQSVSISWTMLPAFPICGSRFAHFFAMLCTRLFFPGLRARGSLRSGYFADSRISGHDQVAGAHHRCFKIIFVRGKHLPARCPASESLNGSHRRKFTPQTFMM